MSVDQSTSPAASAACAASNLAATNPASFPATDGTASEPKSIPSTTPGKPASAKDTTTTSTGPTKPEPNQDAQQQALMRCREEARIVEEFFPGALLAAVAGKALASKVTVQGYKAYLDRLLQAVGAPTNPIEIMMVEQLAQGHYRIAGLHAQSACATTAEQAALFNTAAAKMMSEYRRHAVALRELRNPIAPKPAAVFNQQIIGSGNPNPASVSGAAGHPKNEFSDSELRTKQHRPKHARAPSPDEKTDRRPAKPREAQTANGRRSSKAARFSIAEPAVAALNGSANGHG